MLHAFFSSEKGLLSSAMACIAAVLILPVSLVMKLVTLPAEQPFYRSPDEVARYLRDWLNGTGGEWDWDDFTSMAIADPRLESIRRRASVIEPPPDDGEITQLQALLAEAEAIAAADRAAAPGLQPS